MDEDSESTAPQLVRKVTLLNAILWLDEAWKDLPVTTITKCWRRGGLMASSAPYIEMEEVTEVRLNVLYLTLQSPKKVFVRGLVNFVPAVAYLFCLNLPAAFSQPRTKTFFGLCRGS